MSSFSKSSGPDSGRRAREYMYANMASAYHLGRALSAVFGGLSAVLVSYIYDLPGIWFIFPAALVIAKVMVPETQRSETAEGATAESLERIDANLLDAVARGATEGMKLALTKHEH